MPFQSEDDNARTMLFSQLMPRTVSLIPDQILAPAAINPSDIPDKIMGNHSAGTQKHTKKPRPS